MAEVSENRTYGGLFCFVLQDRQGYQSIKRINIIESSAPTMSPESLLAAMTYFKMTAPLAFYGAGDALQVGTGHAHAAVFSVCSCVYCVRSTFKKGIPILRARQPSDSQAIEYST